MIKTQKGWALMGVLGFCALLAASHLGPQRSLITAQAAMAHRLWVTHSLAAAEAMVQATLLSNWRTRAAPSQGCLGGRCAWLGDVGLSWRTWQTALSSAAACGSDPGTERARYAWPTLPNAALWCWLESTPNTSGDLVRITAWIQGGHADQTTLVQAVWQQDGSEHGVWLSWREVLP